MLSRSLYRMAEALDPTIIDEILADLELIRSGVTVRYVVDPSEVIDYCFPISPTSPKLESPDLSAIAESQAALYEFLEFRRDRPLLVPEYADELEGLTRYFDHTVASVYRDSDLVDGLFRRANLAAEDLRNEDLAQNVEFAEEHLPILIMLALGIYSIGLRRLRKLMQKRLIARRFTTKKDWQNVAALVAAYAPSRHAEIAFDHFQSRMPARLNTVDYERRRQANRVDAEAIDRLIFLNRELAAAHKAGKISGKYVLLYLSSAPKTDGLFRRRDMREAVIPGTEYTIHRRREHLFAYIVCKGRQKRRRARLDATAQTLDTLRRILADADRLQALFSGAAGEAHCESCVLAGGGRPDCRYLDFCRSVDTMSQTLDRKESEWMNLNLVSKLSNYRNILELSSSRRRHKAVVHYLSRLLEADPAQIQEIAEERLLVKNQIITSKIRFAEYIPEVLTFGPYSVRGVSESVTAPGQLLPYRMALGEESESRYGAIVRKVRNYYEQPQQHGGDLERACEDYVILDSAVEDLLFDHELIRAFLYLAFPMERGSELATQLIDDLERQGLIAAKKEQLEAGYVQLWALRRSGQYSRARTLANRLLREFPEDARIFHGKALAIYTWTVDSAARASGARLTIDQAIRDTEKAVRLYRSAGDAEKEVAACINNLAYFYAIRKSRGIRRDIEEARAWLGKLKEIVPKRTWYSMFPEYLHTEAFVELQEARLMRRSEPVAEWKRKLEFARKDIRAALRVFEKKTFVDLAEEIDELLDVAARRQAKRG